MKQLISLAILGIIISGCGPKAPKLTFCIIDGRSAELFCTDPNGKDFVLTIPEAHKYVCESSADAEKLFNYVVELEKKVANCRN